MSLRVNVPVMGTLHAVTKAEAYTEYRAPRGVDAKHRDGYWPEGKSNRELMSGLCRNCSCFGCEVNCAYGREYKRRLSDGRIREAKAV